MLNPLTLSAALLIAVPLAPAAGPLAIPQPTGQPASQTAAEQTPGTLTVSGSAQVSAAPDRAVISLGAVAQASEAAAAQADVNDAVTRAIESIKQLGISDERISTTSISLQPVYSRERPRQPDRFEDEPEEPRIIGYRASNTLQIEVADLSSLGRIIDAGVEAGVNRIQGVNFTLSDDTSQRAEALRLAVQRAKTKAQAMASALGVELVEVREVTEGGVHIVRPQFEGARMMTMDAATPVQPGEIDVSAEVTITWRLGQ